MFYLFTLKNLNFIKPININSLKIFKFNIILIIFSFLILIFFLFKFFLILLIYDKNNKLKKLFCIKNSFYKYILTTLFILFIIIIIIYSTIFLINFKKSVIPFITIKIISYQWRWYYNYINGLGKSVNYFSCIMINFYYILNIEKKKNLYLKQVDNKLIIPVNKNIRLIFTSNDVIHSWFLPSLFIKQDAIPGIYRDIYINCKKIGKYNGYCSELCGKNHSYMPITVNIVSLINYKKWILSILYKKNINFYF